MKLFWLRALSGAMAATVIALVVRAQADTGAVTEAPSQIAVPCNGEVGEGWIVHRQERAFRTCSRPPGSKVSDFLVAFPSEFLVQKFGITEFLSARISQRVPRETAIGNAIRGNYEDTGLVTLENETYRRYDNTLKRDYGAPANSVWIGPDPDSGSELADQLVTCQFPTQSGGAITCIVSVWYHGFQVSTLLIRGRPRYHAFDPQRFPTIGRQLLALAHYADMTATD